MGVYSLHARVCYLIYTANPRHMSMHHWGRTHNLVSNTTQACVCSQIHTLVALFYSGNFSQIYMTVCVTSFFPEFGSYTSTFSNFLLLCQYFQEHTKSTSKQSHYTPKSLPNTKSYIMVLFHSQYSNSTPNPIDLVPNPFFIILSRQQHSLNKGTKLGYIQ